MIEVFKKNNIKCTKNRIIIYNYILNNKGVSINDIKNNTNIDISTIYRIIHVFINNNIIAKNNNDLYFICDHIHYLDCDLCKKSVILNKCPFNNDLDYIINENIKLHGICKSCKEKKVGVFVGSFNPITKAHASIINYLLDNNLLNEVIIVVIDNPKKKDLILKNNRVDMIKLCFDNIKVINDYDIFNYKVLDSIQKNYYNKLSIVIGSDQVNLIDSWDNSDYIKNNYNFIVFNRNGYSNNDYKYIDFNYDISSSMVRKLIKDNIDCTDYLLEEVYQYIKNNELYK